MKDRGLVLDANILIRAVLGKRVRNILERHRHHAKFFSPNICFEEARQHLPAILKRRGIDPLAALEVLDHLPAFVRPVNERLYRSFEKTARNRIDLATKTTGLFSPWLSR